MGRGRPDARQTAQISCTSVYRKRGRCQGLRRIPNDKALSGRSSKKADVTRDENHGVGYGELLTKCNGTGKLQRVERFQCEKANQLFRRNDGFVD